MLFVNLSRDVLQLQSQNRTEEIHFGDLEKTYPQILSDMIAELDDHKILAINGPGGFASLRCGCLSINLLQMLGSDELKIYDISKIDIYKHAYQYGYIPRYGLIYLGQKKNIRLYDLEHNDYQTINSSNLDQLLPEKYFIDDVESHSMFDDLPQSNKVSLGYARDGVTFGSQDQERIILLDSLSLEPSHYLMPNYMMEPTIG